LCLALKGISLSLSLSLSHTHTHMHTALPLRKVRIWLIASIDQLLGFPSLFLELTTL
jgi:hypothetical protein